MAVRVFVVLFCVSLSAVSFAQIAGQSQDRFDSRTSGNASIQGQIVYPAGTILSDFSVELCEPGGAQRMIYKTTINETGGFFFDQVPASVYLVRVTNTSGGVLGEQVVNPVEGQSRVRVRLPDKKDKRLESSLVSMAELSHKVPGKALKEAGEADKALKKGDLNGLIAHLEKVAEIDPAFIAARRNLSLAYLKTLQFEKAIGSFQKLAALDPHSPLPYSGLSATYYDVHQLADSEAAARRALEIDSSYELGHFLLGTTLAAQNKDHQQALRHLAQAIKHFPGAYVTAAGILARQGQREEAKIQLQAYLDSGDTGSRSEAEDLLYKLY